MRCSVACRSRLIGVPCIAITRALPRATRLHHREATMGFRYWTSAAVLASALLLMIDAAAAFDDSLYPDLKGQWRRAGNAGLLAGGAGGIRYDPSKPPKRDPSLGQEPPLTPEYQAINQETLDDMSKGGQGIDPTASCVSPGMPRVMIGYSAMEFVVTPGTTYILIERDHDHFRTSTPTGATFPPTW